MIRSWNRVVDQYNFFFTADDAPDPVPTIQVDREEYSENALVNYI